MHVQIVPRHSPWFLLLWTVDCSKDGWLVFGLISFVFCVFQWYLYYVSLVCVSVSLSHSVLPWLKLFWDVDSLSWYCSVLFWLLGLVPLRLRVNLKSHTHTHTNAILSILSWAGIRECRHWGLTLLFLSFTPFASQWLLVRAQPPRDGALGGIMSHPTPPLSVAPLSFSSIPFFASLSAKGSPSPNIKSSKSQFIIQHTHTDWLTVDPNLPINHMSAKLSITVRKYSKTKSRGNWFYYNGLRSVGAHVESSKPNVPYVLPFLRIEKGHTVSPSFSMHVGTFT